MPKSHKKPQPKTARERMRARRDRLRRQGLRPVQHWVPDLRQPRVREAIRKEMAILARHQDREAIDEWLEAVYAGVEDK
jgi:antidote-toxin recognition MazE-like antitoxin